MAHNILPWLLLLSSSVSARKVAEPLAGDDASGPCKLKIPGVKLSKLMLNEPGSMNVTAETNGHRCLLSVVAVGGGGASRGYDKGAGGSGYVAWAQRHIKQDAVLETYVGLETSYNRHTWAEASTVVFRPGSYGEYLEGMVYAAPGGNPFGDDGGDGYCGGGSESDTKIDICPGSLSILCFPRPSQRICVILVQLSNIHNMSRPPGRGAVGGDDGGDGQGNDDENRTGNSGKGSGFNLTAVDIPGFDLR